MPEETPPRQATDPEPETPPPSGKRDPVRLVTWIVLVTAAVVFAWYLISDRLTPYTDQARIHTLTVPITPRVSGMLTEVRIHLHSRVEQDQLMVKVDPRPYEAAVRSAEANVDLAVQQVGASSATVKAAAANLGVARASLDRAKRNFDRVQAVLARNPGALSQADRDRTETAYSQAQERVASAEANLEKAQRALGEEGPDNAQIRAAVAALEKAQLDLAFTEVVAPFNGVVESFTVDVGAYAQAGQPLGTFLSDRDVWIQADMRENNLGNVDVGDPVEYILDVAPGRVFRGTVRSVGFGVNAGVESNPGGLPKVQGSTGWLRDPQRFPVIIGLGNGIGPGLMRAGGQADVVIYTGNNGLFNVVARLVLRVRSLFSYVR